MKSFVSLGLEIGEISLTCISYCDIGVEMAELETKYLSAQENNDEILMKICFGTLMVKWTKNRNF